MLYRSLVSVIALSLTSALSADAGTRYTDPQGRFSLDVPADWDAATPESPKISLIMGKKAGDDVVGICIIVVSETPQTSGRSQSEITDAMSAMLTKDFWQATYKAQGAQDIAVANIGTRDASGRKVHFVHSEFTTKGQNGATQRMKAQEEIHAVPGRTHDIGCLSKKEKFQVAKLDFDAIQRSYAPQSGLIAQAPSTPGPSVLTLYAQMDFGGVARVVKSETPNITYVSWPTQSGSAMVQGFGEWQVCEGANFSGTCTTLSGPLSSPMGSPLRIGSVRPVVAADPLKALSSSIATDSISLMSEAIKVLRSQR